MGQNRKTKKNTKKKRRINKAILIRNVLILAVIVIGGIFVFTRKKESPGQIVFQEYFAKLQEKNYEAMYDMITKNKKGSISKEDFVLKNQNIYEGIGLSNLTLKIEEIKQDKGRDIINYHATLDTLAGKIEFDNTMTLVEEDNAYKIVWTTKEIFPKLATNDKVKVNMTQRSKRQYLR